MKKMNKTAFFKKGKHSKTKITLRISERLDHVEIIETASDVN